MQKLLILAAVAALSVACHNRSEDETGAAPDQGDATVTATDSASVPTDSTMGQRPSATDTTAVSQDTTSVSSPAPVEGDSALIHHQTPDSNSAGAMTDSTGMGHEGMNHDSTAVQGDSAMTNSSVPDTTASQ
jgi:hypothetical protein